MRHVKWLGASLALLALAGCGDAPTSDDRGFTKAPLETLTVFIQPEQRSEVRSFAHLNRPDGQPIAPPPASAPTGG